MCLAELNENESEYELQVQIEQVQISTRMSFVFILGRVLIGLGSTSVCCVVAIFVLLFAYEMIVDFVQQVHEETFVQNAQIQCPQAHAWHHQLFHFEKHLITRILYAQVKQFDALENKKRNEEKRSERKRNIFLFFRKSNESNYLIELLLVV